MRILSCSLLLVTACSAPQVARAPRADEPTLRVLVYNVNYGLARQGVAEPTTLQAIVDARADVVLLQETTPQWETAIRADRALTQAYPHVHYHHEGHGPGGLAILSKYPLDDVELLPQVTWFPASRVVINSPIGKVQALNVHLRPPFDDEGSIVSGYFTTPKIRRSEIEHFAVALDDTLPTIVVGDFNEDDGSAVQHLKELGFVDAVPRFAPSAHTWRWKVSSVQVKGRLDHVMHDAQLEALDVRVIDAGESDHLPIVAVIARAQRT